MPLFVSANPQEGSVGLELAHIVGTDNGNLGVPSGGGGAETRVTYTQGETSFAKNRMNALVNSTPNNDIVITGVNGTFVLQGGVFTGSVLDGQPITAVGGGIVVIRIPQDLNAAQTGVPAGVRIPVLFDVSGCNGAGYCVPGTGGAPVADPTMVVLFHELAHAFHMAANTLTVNNLEPQARNDENQLRAEASLPARSPTDNSNPGCGVCGTGTTKTCLIVTAAYGSALAEEVRALQGFRDRVLRTTRVGNAFFEALAREYYRFSTRLSLEMERHPPLRAEIRRVLVEPLVDFLAVLEQLVRPADDGAARGRVAELLEQRRAAAAVTEPIPATRARVRGLHERVTAGLREPFSPRMLVAARAGDPDAVLRYVERLVLWRPGPELDTLTWALLRPLVLIWDELARLDRDSPEVAAAGLLAATEEWLGQAPIPPVAYSSARGLRSDLDLLRSTVLTPAAARHGIGARLLDVVAGLDPGRLAAALRDAGYLDEAPDGRAR